MSDSSQNALRKQRLNLIIAAVIGGVVVIGVGNYMFSNYKSPSYQLFDHKIDLPVDEFKSKEVWMDRLESQLNFLTQKQKYFEETLLEYKEREQANEKEKTELKRHLAFIKKEMEEAAKNLKKNEGESQFNAQPTLSLSDEKLNKRPVLIDEEDSFDLPLPQRIQSAPVLNDPFVSPVVYAAPHRSDELSGQPIDAIQLRPPISEYSLHNEEKNELFSVEKRTPANVSVKAILISSVDAVCRLDAQSDPIPVKLRLLDDAYLPGGVVVKLKGCLIGASAFGDISSERVYMRLENLTKVNPNGMAIESEVTGYVSGEDGRFGMRGVVIDRSAKILKPALGSGILSGIAQTLQAACMRPPKESISTYTVGTDFAQNTAAGTSDAFNMLASYYIKRAEQVQPVLQIDAGRLVDVTFTHGFSMGDIHAKANLKQVREKTRGR